MPIIIEVSTNATASVADLAKLKAAITDAIAATNKQTEATKTQGDAADKAGRQGSSSKQQEKRDTDSLAAAFKGAQGAFSGFIGQLQREADMLQSIHGPMEETQNDLKALDALYRRGSLSITEYTAKSRDLQKQLDQQTRSAHGLPGASSGGGPSDGLSGVIQGAGSAAGPAGEILGAVTTGAVVQIGAVVGLAAAVIHLHDSYIELENQAMRIVGANGDLNGTIKQQLALAGDLHGSLSTTMALTAKVREGTQDYYLTQKQMADMTRTVGEAVQLSGHPLEDAAGVMERLTFAFEQGTVGPRELRGIMREFPAIADGLAKSFGKTQHDLLDMAKAGELSGVALLNALQKMGPTMDATFSGRIETYGQKWKHFQDQMTVDAGQGHGLDIADTVATLGDLAKGNQLKAGAQQFASDFSKSGDVWSAAFGGSDSGPAQASKGTEDYVEKILEATGAESRFYDVLAGVSKELRDQSGFYKGVTDAINAQRDALRAAGFQEDTYVAKIVRDVTDMNNMLAHATPGQIGGVGARGSDQLVTDRRKLRDSTDDMTAATESYGKTVQDAHKKTNEHHDGIEDLNKAYKAGQINTKEFSDGMKALSEDFAFQYNVIHSIINPAREYGLTLDALLGGLKSGTIDLVQFNDAMAKLHGLTNQRFLDNEQLAKMGVGAYSFGKDKTGQQQSGVLSYDTEDKANPEIVQQLKDMTEAYKNFNHEQTLGAKYVDDQMRHQEEYTAILGDARTAAEKYGQELKILSDPKVLVTDDERAQALQNLKDKYTTIQTPQDAYTKALRKIVEEELLVGGSTEAYANAMRDLRVQFNQGDAMDGFSQGIDNINKSINVSASASKLLSDSFDGVLNGLNELAVKGTTDFHSMTQAIEADLLRLMENQLLRALFGGSLGGDNPAGAAGAVGGLTSWIPGFASGTGPEGITVGGSGPPDSKLMRVSPGEHVTVQTGQQRQRSQQSGAAPGINIINVSNAQEAAHAEMNSRRGESTLINALAKNSRMIGHITRR